MRRLLVLALALGACRSAPPPAPPPDGLSELAAARAARAAGDLAGARAHLETALRQSPALALADVELADVLVQQGDHGPELQRALAEAQAQASSNPRTWELSAAVAEEQGDRAATVLALRRLTALRPDDAAALHRLASALAGGGAWAEAVAVYRAALAIDPGATPSRLALAELLEQNAKLAEAEIELTTLTRQAPHNALFARKLEALLVREGKRAPPVKSAPAMRPLRPSRR